MQQYCISTRLLKVVNSGKSSGQEEEGATGVKKCSLEYEIRAEKTLCIRY